MKAVEIKGIIPPVITPMNEDESINEAELTAFSPLGQTGKVIY